MKEPDRPLSSLPKILNLRYCPGGEEQAARAMEEWVASLMEEAGGKIAFTRVADPPFLPSLSITTKASSSVHYHFVPEGPEVPVFREFLRETAEKGNSGGPGAAEPSRRGAPRQMLLFVSTHCPNCPTTVRTVLALSTRLAGLDVHLLEATMHPEAAQQYAIQSVPTLLIDQGPRYTGSLDEEKLFSLLREEDPASLLRERIRQQIKGGCALEAAAWIAGGGDPSFLAPDLGKSTFEERIALLVALEEALESDPRCLDRMIDPLLPYLAAENASVRGDIADLLGKIGKREALPALQSLLKDPDPNVVEAAAEAMENIEGLREEISKP